MNFENWKQNSWSINMHMTLPVFTGILVSGGVLRESLLFTFVLLNRAVADVGAIYFVSKEQRIVLKNYQGC